MKGKKEEEIIAVRKKSIKDVREKFGEHVTILDSYFGDYNPEGGSIPMKYLARSIEIMADADLVYFAPGFDSARGCWIEYECAKAYGLETHVSIVGG